MCTGSADVAAPGRLYVVAEHYGRTLADLREAAAPQGLPVATVATVARQVVSALVHLHDRALCHRHLAVAAVVVASTDPVGGRPRARSRCMRLLTRGAGQLHVLVTNHGLAHMTGQGADVDFPLGCACPAALSIRNRYEGSWSISLRRVPATLAPELIPRLAAGELVDVVAGQRVWGALAAQAHAPFPHGRKRVGPQADVWAMGVVLLELATGRSLAHALSDTPGAAWSVAADLAATLELARLRAGTPAGPPRTPMRTPRPQLTV
jgi:serine/threonine protein kinase